MPVNLVSTEDLTFFYDGIEVLRDISLTVKKGDYLGIVGPNGSGKSTLIKNILGILQPQKGSVYIFRQTNLVLPEMDKDRLFTAEAQRSECIFPLHREGNSHPWIRSQGR